MDEYVRARSYQMVMRCERFLERQRYQMGSEVFDSLIQFATVVVEDGKPLRLQYENRKKVWMA